MLNPWSIAILNGPYIHDFPIPNLNERSPGGGRDRRVAEPGRSHCGHRQRRRGGGQRHGATAILKWKCLAIYREWNPQTWGHPGFKFNKSWVCDSTDHGLKFNRSWFLMQQNMVFNRHWFLDQPLNQQQIMVLDSNGCQVCLVSLTVDL